jgi:hypothetical protein
MNLYGHVRGKKLIKLGLTEVELPSAQIQVELC